MTELSRLRIVDEPRRHLSFSQLNTFQQCGMKYRLAYVDRVEREPQGGLIGGIATHESIEHAETENLWPDESAFGSSDAPAIAFFRERLAALVESSGGPDAIRWGGRGQGEDLPWWEKNGEFMLRRYRATREAMDSSGWGIVEGGVEMRVVAELPGVDVPVLGYLDKFLMHDGGELCIVDYSTGKIGGKQPMQFATYARLLEESRGLHVERATAVYLRATDAARRVASVPFVALVEHMDEVYAGLVAGIEREAFEPNPSAFCSSCYVRESCWYWKAIEPE